MRITEKKKYTLFCKKGGLGERKNEIYDHGRIGGLCQRVVRVGRRFVFGAVADTVDKDGAKACLCYFGGDHRLAFTGAVDFVLVARWVRYRFGVAVFGGWCAGRYSFGLVIQKGFRDLSAPFIRGIAPIRRYSGGVAVVSAVIAIAVGLATGVLSGFGVGGGSLLILYLTAVAGTDQYTAGGINLLYFLCCAPAALISHIRHKRVEWRAVWWCVLTGVATSLVAAWLASRIDTALLRRLFGILLLYIGTRELFCKSEKKKA